MSIRNDTHPLLHPDYRPCNNYVLACHQSTSQSLSSVVKCHRRALPGGSSDGILFLSRIEGSAQSLKSMKHLNFGFLDALFHHLSLLQANIACCTLYKSYSTWSLGLGKWSNWHICSISDIHVFFRFSTS